MLSDRLRRRIYRILDQLEVAADRGEWTAVRQGSRDVLIFDPENADALTFLADAQRALDVEGGSASAPGI